MNKLAGLLMEFWHRYSHKPARLLPILAFACAVTLCVALVSDALRRRREQKKKSALSQTH